MSKKLLTLCITILFIVGLLPMVAAAAPPAQGGGTVYTVQKDDWLSRIAEKEYGDPLAFNAIVHYNNLKAASDSSITIISDPDVLEVGWTIYLPSPADAEAFLAEGGTSALPSEFNEAPMLAALVEAGKLPPVEERLPAEPLVVQPVDSVGEYGGTWRRAFRGINDFHAWGRINYEPMLRWPRDPTDPVQPGLAKSWQWSDGGRTLTLVLREGLKWSDGAPFTVDDIIFWWEDIENNPDITAAPHAEWVVNGEPMTVEKVDDLTVRLKFAGPNGLAETTGLAFHGNQWPLSFERFGFFAPRHYLEQFHPKYNSSLTDYTLFEEKADDYNIERPVMTPWDLVKWDPGGTELILERNPYYWKVDIAGNQLPYIDRVHFALVDDNEAINLMALAGEIDMQTRGIDFAKFPVFQENAAAGGYHTTTWSNAQASALNLFPNQSYGDPKYRELMQNFKFRQALSLAIDRDLINDVSYLGQAIPRTETVVQSSPCYIPELEDYNAQYDPDTANALLDEIGLTVGADGNRTFPDGSPLELVVETNQTSGSGLDAIELVAENWQAVGLKTAILTMSRDVYWPKAGGNEVMIATWGTDRGLVPMVDPIYQFPFDERSWMAPSFGTWYKTNGAEGEEPTADFKTAMDLYEEYKVTVDPARQVAICKELVRMSTEGLWTIGTVGMNPSLVVIKDNFKNVIEDPSWTADWIIMSPGTQDPSHYYFDQ
jgi:peptide/nickel transport system substrate-binding protein